MAREKRLIGSVVLTLALFSPLQIQRTTAFQDPPPSELSTYLRKVSKEVSPAVVTINTTLNVKPDEIDKFNRFPQKESPLLTATFVRKNGGRVVIQGSGMIISQDGYILTISDLAEKTGDIEVKLKDSRKFKGEVISYDEKAHLGVIKIDALNLPTVSLGDSDTIKEGAWVVAIGSPFDKEQTVTTGIISKRSLLHPDLIQTDTSINPGDGGGPLINLSGKVIGINIWLITDSGGNQGINFAMPSNVARSVFKKFLNLN